MSEVIKINIPGSILAEIGFDVRSSDGSPEENEIAAEIKRAEFERRGKGRSLVMRVSRKTAVYIAQLLDFYGDSTDLDPDAYYRVSICRSVAKRIRESLK